MNDTWVEERATANKTVSKLTKPGGWRYKALKLTFNLRKWPINKSMHYRREAFRQKLGWIVSTHESWLCTSPLNSTFNDFTLIAWHHPWLERDWQRLQIRAYFCQKVCWSQHTTGPTHREIHSHSHFDSLACGSVIPWAGYHLRERKWDIIVE